jgi:predicted transcriptional regulator
MADTTNGANPSEDVLRMVSDVVSAYVRNHTVSTTELPALIRTVHRALTEVDGVDGAGAAVAVAGVARPAVAVRKSVHPDYIICLEDGRKLKMLKRYLRTRYNMTPEEYRAKWQLPADYPMVAPSYSNQRSKFAKKIGLGRRRGDEA